MQPNAQQAPNPGDTDTDSAATLPSDATQQDGWPLLDIIMPTYNNRAFLEPCLRSLYREMGGPQIFRLWIVNNGDPDSCNWIEHPGVTILEPGENLGWTRALATALPYTSAPVVCFMNDDIFIPPSSRGFLNRLLAYFEDERVAGVGPATTEYHGPQSIFTEEPDVVDARMLLGCCMLLWREALDAVGGIDTSWWTGDDLDLSMRLRRAGYTLVVDKRELVYHHGGVTGGKLYGLYEEGGWRGQDTLKWMYDRLNERYGAYPVWELTAPNPPAYTPPTFADEDAETPAAD